MQDRRVRARAGGFTLLELLIVVCIIAILVTMVITTLGGARRRAQVAVARSNIQAIKAALAMYESDTGRYPFALLPVNKQTLLTGTPGATLYKNDIAWAWAALRNRPTAVLGGGPNSPYLEWKPEQVGVAMSGVDITSKDFGTAPSGYPVTFGTWANPLSAGDNNFALPQNDPNAPAGSPGTGGQTAHLAGSGVDFVFLDPWGSPFYYIEWASVPSAMKDTLATSTSVTINSLPIGSTGSSTTTGSAESHVLVPHDISKFDIWSFGPNGVNEAGEGDDVASWTDTKK